MADVKYDFAADVTAAERAIARLEQKTEKLENQLRETHRTSRRGNQDAVAGMQRWAAGLLTVGAAYATVGRAVGAVVQQNRQLADEVSALIKRLSEEELKLQIQAGFTPPQLERAIPVIGRQILETPAVDLPQAIALSTQLQSSGFKQIDIDSGAALQTILQLQAATNQFGKALENPKETTKAISKLLKGLGLENTADNILRVGGDFAELFAGMDIQAKDLIDLAGVASTLTAAGQSPQEQLAAFAAITEVLPSGAQAATTLKQLTAQSNAAGGTPKGQRGLATLGIRAEQIDLEGESVIDVLERLGASLERLKAEGRGVEAQRALFDIFGNRAGANILSAISVAPRAREALGVVQGQGFEQAVGIFQGSRFADNQRTLIQTQLLERQIGQGKTFDEVRDEIKLLSAASAAGDVGGIDRFNDMVNLAGAQMMAATLAGLGATPDESPLMNELLTEIRSQTHILQELRALQPNDRQRSTRSVNRDAHTEDAVIDERMSTTRN